MRTFCLRFVRRMTPGVPAPEEIVPNKVGRSLTTALAPTRMVFVSQFLAVQVFRFGPSQQQGPVAAVRHYRTKKSRNLDRAVQLVCDRLVSQPQL